MAHILVADDDKELCQLLQDYLDSEGFDVTCCHDGLEVILQLQNGDFDLLLLDVMMPHKNGFETLNQLRKNSNLPVIMLTAKGEPVDRILGLEMGADDYIAKPYDPRELVARVRAILRRSNRHEPVTPTAKIEISGVTLEKSTRSVQVDGLEIELTSTEFDFLALLMDNAGQLVSRQVISQTCLGKKLQPFDRSIDMHLSNLRKKLGDYQSQPRIKTVRGYGYQFLRWDLEA